MYLLVKIAIQQILKWSCSSQMHHKCNDKVIWISCCTFSKISLTDVALTHQQFLVPQESHTASSCFFNTFTALFIFCRKLVIELSIHRFGLAKKISNCSIVQKIFWFVQNRLTTLWHHWKRIEKLVGVFFIWNAV